MKGHPIWDSGRSSEVYLLKRLAVDVTSEIELFCRSSSPFAFSLDDTILFSGPGPTLGLPVPLRVTHTLPRGVHTLEVRAVNLPAIANPWFHCTVTGEHTAIATDNCWLVAAGASTAIDCEAPYEELHRADRDPRHLGSQIEWSPATEVASAGEEPPEPCTIAETAVRAHRVSGFGELGPGRGSHARPGSFAAGKCVHPDGLLAGSRARTLVTTGESSAVVIQLDFGRIVTGYPQLRLQTAGAGGAVDLCFSHDLQPAVDARSVRYIARLGRQSWRGLRQQSGRYALVKLSGFVGDCYLEAIELVTRGVALTAVSGSPEATAAIPDMRAVGVRTLDAVRQEIYYLSQPPHSPDCLAALTALLNDCYLTGNTRTTGTLLRSCCSPGEGIEPAESTALPLVADAYCLYSGDLDTGRAVLPAMMEIVAALRKLDEHHEPVDASASQTAEVAIAASAAAAAERVCRYLGETESADRCRAEKRRLKALARRAWRASAGLFADRLTDQDATFSQWTNGLALRAGLADEHMAGQITAEMRGAHVAVVESLLQAFFVGDGLWRAGAEARCLDNINMHWGRLHDREGDTWADKATRSRGPYEPGPEYLIGACMLGLRPLAPGFAVAEIRPPRRLPGASTGTLATPFGNLGASWQRTDPGIRITAETPAGMNVRCVCHRNADKRPTITLNGQTVWRNEKIHPNPFVQQVDLEEDSVVLVLSRQGSYTVTVE